MESHCPDAPTGTTAGPAAPPATTVEPASQFAQEVSGSLDPDQILELIGQWEERYRLGEDPAPEALGVADPLMIETVREAIARQKRFYARLNLPGTPGRRPDHHDEPLPSFPDHETLAKIGQGGMGVVYKARDLKLGRLVAIKTIIAGRYVKASERDRFQAEAQAIARLRHPHIIAIHSTGEHEGRQYFSMEYAEGGSLARRLAIGPMVAIEAALVLEKLALAVQAAHEAGIVHRDLKPSNVLLTHDGSPKIGDFGLAKLVDAGSAHTLSGQVLGSPSYMAPEQAEGHSKKVGSAIDIYALGAVLYQVLTGRPPFLGETQIETLKLVVSTEPVPPRRQRPGVPRDLETICLKCLEKEPGRRYQSAAALAGDLRRFVEGRPIAARPVSAIGRLWRWGRRNPMLAGTAAALLLTFALGTPTLFGLWLRARADRSLAETESRHAQAARDHAEASRDQALAAVDMLLRGENNAMFTEEMLAYRKASINAGIDVSLAVVRALEGDPRAEFQLALAYTALARVQAAAGEAAATRESARKAIALAESQVARDPSSVHFRVNLATTLHRVGALLPDAESRQSAAERSNEILRSLSAEHAEGDRKKWIAQIAMNQYNTGDALYKQGRAPEAFQAFLAAKASYDELQKLGEPSATMRDYTARNLHYLCRAYPSERFDEMIATGQQAVTIFQSLVHEKPDSGDYAWQLFQACEELGLKYLTAEKWQEAICSLTQARQTLKDWAARPMELVSRMAVIQGGLAEVDFNLTEAYDSDPVRYAGPRRAMAEEIYKIGDKLSLLGPLLGNLRVAFARSAFDVFQYEQDDGRQPDLELLVTSERYCAAIHHDAPANDDYRKWLVQARRQLAFELEASGHYDQAAHWQSQALTPARGRPELFYQLALTYATNAGIAGKDPTKLGASQLEARRARLSADAVAMLREAVADGFRDARRLRNEPKLDPIRSDPGFAAVLAGLDFPADSFAPRR